MCGFPHPLVRIAEDHFNGKDQAHIAELRGYPFMVISANGKELTNKHSLKREQVSRNSPIGKMLLQFDRNRQDAKEAV